jgi:hypothetical protein
MTATDDRPTTCPSWCTAQPCRREHTDLKTFIPATGGRPVDVGPEQGARFPIVGVGLDWSELDGEELPEVCLWLTGGKDDVDVYLKPREAQQVVEALQARLLTLVAEKLL